MNIFNFQIALTPIWALMLSRFPDIDTFSTEAPLTTGLYNKLDSFSVLLKQNLCS